MKNEHDDIINQPRHSSIMRPHMTAIDRASQFSPFAALTGYDAAIKETARLTDERVEMDECSTSALNDRLQMIAERIAEQPEIAVTYFQPDTMKSGGSYATTNSTVKRIDTYKRMIIMTDGTTIPLDEIVGIEGALFESLSSL